MTRHYRQHAAERAVERNLTALRALIAGGAPPAHLAPIVDLLDALIAETGGTLLTRQYRVELAQAKATIAKPTLRLVKS